MLPPAHGIHRTLRAGRMGAAAKPISAVLAAMGCSIASPLNNVGSERCSRTGEVRLLRERAPQVVRIANSDAKHSFSLNCVLRCGPLPEH